MRMEHDGRAHPRRDGGVEYRLLVAATFLFVLPAAALRRLIPRAGGSRGSIPGGSILGGSVLAEAREEARTVISIAFAA